MILQCGRSLLHISIRSLHESQRDILKIRRDTLGGLSGSLRIGRLGRGVLVVCGRCVKWWFLGQRGLGELLVVGGLVRLEIVVAFV